MRDAIARAFDARRSPATEPLLAWRAAAGATRAIGAVLGAAFAEQQDGDDDADVLKKSDGTLDPCDHDAVGGEASWTELLSRSFAAHRADRTRDDGADEVFFDRTARHGANHSHLVRTKVYLFFLHIYE